MSSQTVSRRLSRRLIGVAMEVSPGERQEWAQAMSREADEIPSDREALRWAFGCLRASCHERLKSMKWVNSWPVRWGMALWVALLAIDSLAYAEHALTYKLGLFTEPYSYPQNIPLLKVTPLWEPLLALACGAVFLVAVVLILKRSRAALHAIVTPLVIMLLLFVVRASRPESVILRSLSADYQTSPYHVIWPLAGLAVTIFICLALRYDRQGPAVVR
jgi:hypothetical protein